MGSVVAAALVVQAQSGPRTLTVDVAVVDRDGKPISSLTAAKFDVEGA